MTMGTPEPLKKPPGCLLRYGASVLIVLLAAILTRLLESLTSNCSPLFMVAVIVSAWYGGLGPGLLAIALSVLALDYLYLPPVYTLYSGLADVGRLGVFGLAAALINSLYAARRRAEDALMQALIQERVALAEAEAANHHKEWFLAFLGHELRTPLATIRNFTELLDSGGPDSATLVWGRGLLGRQVEHMSRLLEDLLDISRITRGKIELRRERLDLTRLLRATADDYRSLQEKAGVFLNLELPEEPVSVIGDPTRLAQVVGNLLGNASKFTDVGGSITLRLTTTDDSRWAAVTVRDTGVGIEPEMLPHVFDMFVQAERTRERSNGGLGFGLALVKGLVELHGGKVHVASQGLGHGTEFTVSLPLQPRPDAVGASPAAATTIVPETRMPHEMRATA